MPSSHESICTLTVLRQVESPGPLFSLNSDLTEGYSIGLLQLLSSLTSMVDDGVHSL